MSAKKESITVGKNTVQISDLTVEDQATAQILSEIDPERREEFLIKSIKIGTSVQRNQMTVENIDYVQKEFNRLVTELEENVAKWENNIIEAMEASLDPDSEGKPIAKLMRHLILNLNDIKRLISEKEGEEGLREQTAAKGAPFEEEVERHLELIKSPNDSVEAVGEIAVEGTRRKVGDVLVTTEEPGHPQYKIVFEVKAGDYTLTGPKSLKKQLTDSMELRGARGGIAVVRRRYLKTKQKIWQEEGNNRLIIAVDEDEVEKTTDFTLLEVAYAIMRTRLLQITGGTAVNTPKINPAEVELLVGEISEALEVVKGLKNNCTTVSTAMNDIQAKIATMEVKIKNAVLNILALLGQENSA